MLPPITSYRIFSHVQHQQVGSTQAAGSLQACEQPPETLPLDQTCVDQLNAGQDAATKDPSVRDIDALVEVHRLGRGTLWDHEEAVVVPKNERV